MAAGAQEQCQWCAELAVQNGPSPPCLGFPISYTAPCWRDCATQHWETGSPSGCRPTRRTSKFEAAILPSTLQLVEATSQRHFSWKFVWKFFVKKYLWLSTAPSGLLIELLYQGFLLSSTHKSVPTLMLSTWPSLWYDTIKTRCSERRLHSIWPLLLYLNGF